MATKTINVSFPPDTLSEIDKFAKKEGLSRSDVLRIGTRKYIRDFAKWQLLQDIGEKQAKKAGLETEEQIVQSLQ